MIRKSLIFVLALASAGMLFAAKVNVASVSGTTWNDYMGPLHQQSMSTQAISYNQGILTGETTLTNNTHSRFYGTTEVYFYKSENSVKPYCIYNIKSQKNFTGFQLPSKIGWKSQSVKHELKAGAKKWQVWKTQKVAGIVKENWSANVKDIAKDAPYVEIKNSNATTLLGQVAVEYVNLVDYGTKVATAIANKENPTKQINDLIDYAAASPFATKINEKNAPEFKQLLQNFGNLVTKDIAPLVKNNKEDVKSIVKMGIQLITGGTPDINSTDALLNKINLMVMSDTNTANIKDSLNRLSAILINLENLNVIKNEAFVQKYATLLKNTADSITDGQLMSYNNSVLVFDGLKIVIRLASSQNYSELSALTESWCANGLIPYLHNNTNLNAQQIEAEHQIVVDTMAVVVKGNGQYIKNIGQIIKDVNSLIKEKTNIKDKVNNIISFLNSQKVFLHDNQTELLAIFQNLKVLIPGQSNLINTIIQFIESNAGAL